MCAMTHPPVPWLIHVCDMTLSKVCLPSQKEPITLSHVESDHIPLASVCRDSYICVTWTRVTCVCLFVQKEQIAISTVEADMKRRLAVLASETSSYCAVVPELWVCVYACMCVCAMHLFIHVVCVWDRYIDAYRRLDVVVMWLAMMWLAMRSLEYALATRRAA